MISTVGLGLLIYGKRQQRIPQIVVGILMLVYPYFVPGWILPAVIAVALLALMSAAIHFGM